MPVRDRNRITDGFVTLDGGIDSGVLPSLVSQNQGSWAVNSLFRGGYWTHRFGYDRQPLTFHGATPEIIEERKTAFETGYFQGAGVYESDNCETFIMASISGRIFKISLQDFSTEELLWGDRNSSVRPKVWFCQAENYQIIQNAQDPALIYDGATIRASKGIDELEVPAGGPMAYGKGRLWVARGHEYLGGDLLYSDGTRAAILGFTENDFLSEGGAFAVPSQTGQCSPITALHFPSNLDTALGQGDLFVFTPNDIFIFDAPIDRTTWKNLQYPLQRFGLKNYGTFSADSVVEANSDLYFRAEDGIRSFIQARRDFQSQWGNTPISSEEDRVIVNTNTDLLYATSAVVWNNLKLTTVLPYKQRDRGVWHRGLAVLDVSPVSTMRQKAPPCWAGVWTGPPMLHIIKARVAGIERCFFLGLTPDRKIALWEIIPDARFDDIETPIEWALETRSMPFQSPLDLKRLTTADLWADSMAGNVRFDFAYRADLNPCWQKWHCWEECTQFKDCAEPEGTDPCLSVHTYLEQTRCRMSLPEPQDVDDPPNKKMHRDGYEFQLRIYIKGHARLLKFRAVADRLDEQLSGNISDPCQD